MKKIVLFILGSCITTFLFGQTAEIKATDFGAVPNDNKDDTPAILSAIEACKYKKNQTWYLNLCTMISVEVKKMSGEKSEKKRGSIFKTHFIRTSQKSIVCREDICYRWY